MQLENKLTVTWLVHMVFAHLSPFLAKHGQMQLTMVVNYVSWNVYNMFKLWIQTWILKTATNPALPQGHCQDHCQAFLLSTGQAVLQLPVITLATLVMAFIFVVF